MESMPFLPEYEPQTNLAMTLDEADPFVSGIEQSVETGTPEPTGDEGVEILLQMARRGEINPWDVDLVQVANKYLEAIENREEKALRITGKTLLYLAILLRMKSDLLAGLDPWTPVIEDADFGEFGEEGFDGGFDPDGILAPRTAPAIKTLDDVLERRTSVKQPRIRRVTLKDLIRELKKFEALEKERLLREKVEKIDRRRQHGRDYSALTTEEITDLAHEEFHEELVALTKNILHSLLPDKSATVALDLLQEACQLDQISTFLSLLFLEAQGEVEIQQKEFYSTDISILLGPGNWGVAAENPIDVTEEEA